MRLEMLDEVGRVEAVLVTLSGSCSQRQDQIEVLVDQGVKGDRHAGTKLSDVREEVLREIGVGKEVPMANVRQFSAISSEDLLRIGERMKTPTDIPFGLCGENLVISGFSWLSQLPCGTLLTFAKEEAGQIINRKAVLAVWGENNPCRIPNDSIVAHFSGSEPFTPAKPFASAARGKRGIVGFVYCSGKIKPGDIVSAWRPKSAE